jgi:hypothetical protein
MEACEFMTERKVVLELSGDEALVFFDWLHRFNEAEGNTFEDQSEQRVLWNMEAMLESAIVEPLDPKYEELLTAARASVRDSVE